MLLEGFKMIKKGKRGPHFVNFV